MCSYFTNRTACPEQAAVGRGSNFDDRWRLKERVAMNNDLNHAKVLTNYYLTIILYYIIMNNFTKNRVSQNATLLRIWVGIKLVADDT